MKNNRRNQIDSIKKEILIELDKMGTYEINFKDLFLRLKNNKFNLPILKKYIGLLFDDDFIDINSGILKDRAKIKSSIEDYTKIQITSNGQNFIYPPKKRWNLKKIMHNPWIVGIISSLVVGLGLYLIIGK